MSSPFLFKVLWFHCLAFSCKDNNFHTLSEYPSVVKVMETLSPQDAQRIGDEFVKLYYKLLKDNALDKMRGYVYW